MSGRVLIGATIAAVGGALIWGGIAVTTGYEVGYVAWGIGALVGGVAAKLGSEGTVGGVACALFAVASIFVGKMFAVRWSAPQYIRTTVEGNLTEQMYDDEMKAAGAFAQLSSDQQHAAFMVEHEFTDAPAADQVTEEELTEFREHKARRLSRLHQEKPDYRAWREDMIGQFTAFAMADAQTSRIVIETLGPIDILFALLGIATAYRLGSGSGEA